MDKIEYEYEYEIVKPKEPIRIVRKGRVNYHIDATGFCFAQYLADYDREKLKNKGFHPTGE